MNEILIFSKKKYSSVLPWKLHLLVAALLFCCDVPVSEEDDFHHLEPQWKRSEESDFHDALHCIKNAQVYIFLK